MKKKTLGENLEGDFEVEFYRIGRNKLERNLTNLKKKAFREEFEEDDEVEKEEDEGEKEQKEQEEQEQKEETGDGKKKENN